MLTSTTILKRIDDIVEKAYLDFTFDIIGADFFSDEQKRQIESLGLIIGRKPLIELLYILVRQRPHEGYKKDATLTELLDQVALSGVLPIITDAQRYSIEHAKASINKSIEDTKTLIKKKLTQKILDANQEYKQHVIVNRLTSLPQQIEYKNKFLAPLLLSVGAILALAHKNFVRAFTTDLTDSINDATVDAATTSAMISRTAVEEIKVYKTVMNDAKLCNWCHKFYLNKDGSPKIFALTELQENGVNDPAKKSSWKPVIGATHPRCRCQLHKV